MDLVVDNASIFYFDENDPFGSNEYLLRLFKLQRGYSIAAGIPGHYLNANSDPEQSAVDVIEAPCVLTFVDEGLPAKLCIAFRKYGGTKICAKALEMPLQISAGGEDKEPKFYKWKEAGSVKLDVIKSFIPLARSDGYNMVKNYETWIKKAPSPMCLSEKLNCSRSKIFALGYRQAGTRQKTLTRSATQPLSVLESRSRRRVARHPPQSDLQLALQHSRRNLSNWRRSSAG